MGCMAAYEWQRGCRIKLNAAHDDKQTNEYNDNVESA